MLHTHGRFYLVDVSRDLRDRLELSFNSNPTGVSFSDVVAAHWLREQMDFSQSMKEARLRSSILYPGRGVMSSSPRRKSFYFQSDFEVRFP